MKRVFGIAAVLVSALIAGCTSGSDVVSKSEFGQISDGMSYSQVVSIIGEEGSESSSGTMPGVPGVMESITTKMYTWQNSDGSNMNAMFQNDKLMNKAQFGLK
jgi:hypothetical protein